jgi:ABC-type lipoprotein release transport system permease subunit
VGRLALVWRLAVRDLRRRPLEAALVLLVLTATTTTLTLALVLQDAAGDPYDRTRAATEGPDVVASTSPSTAGAADDDPTAVVPDPPPEVSRLEDLADARGVLGHSGPHPVISGVLQASGRTSDVQAIGRDTRTAAVDEPELTQGSWTHDGGVVIEAAFAHALDLRVGDQVTLDSRAFDVVGVAVTAAMAPYPKSSCILPCASGVTRVQRSELPPGLLVNPGLVWLTEADVRSLADGSLSYVMSLALADPDTAEAFVDANRTHGADAPLMESWQDIRRDATELARDAQILLLLGAWLLGLLAVASVSVLVGGRMADQTRRVGLLKAVGGTPWLVAAVLFAEYVLVALGAVAAGVGLGSLTAPLLTDPGAGLLGTAGTPPIAVSTAALVTAAALVVAVASAALPALRAARTSTVVALADAARPPRRTGWLIALSARLPVPLLLALRVAARRPRRVVLGVVSIAISVSGVFVGLVLDTFLTTQAVAVGDDDAHTELLRQVLLVVMSLVVALAAVNALFITVSTVLDNRRSTALTRALGATPREVSLALGAAQVLPALAGALVGAFPGGLALYHLINAVTGGDSGRAMLPPLWQLVTLVAGTVLVVTALTAAPAHLGGRLPVVESLST